MLLQRVARFVFSAAALFVCLNMAQAAELLGYFAEVLASRRAEPRDDIISLLASALPGYIAEGKRYVSVAIGCTGGKHRSVYVAEALKRELKDMKGVSTKVVHRDLVKGR